MQKITQILSQKISANFDKIEDFFTKKFSKYPALFYNSVDLRHAGFKIAPIDTNCFSAGFNNLSLSSQELAREAIANFLKNNFPDAKNILLIPENHTKNLRYLENVLSFKNLFSQNIVIGSLIENLAENTTIDLENGTSITLHPLQRINDKITTKDGFIPDLIVLNNDLTDGIPEVLTNLATPIIPALSMGWHQRTKSNHFTIYNNLAAEFAQLIDIDPWLISSMHRSCHEVNFKEQTGIACLAKYVDELIADLTKKYQEYGIDEQPYCFIKADNGTYGIAVWAVFGGAEVLEINKKERNKMNMLKGSIQTTQVMIQEGIKTLDKIDNKIAEPLIYLVDGHVIGNLFRVNENRDEKISLNASGMSFCDLNNLEENQINLGASKNEITKIYSIIARLAALAAAIENVN
jgi:glutamate--cysteine ligase